MYTTTLRLLHLKTLITISEINIIFDEYILVNDWMIGKPSLNEIKYYLHVYKHSTERNNHCWVNYNFKTLHKLHITLSKNIQITFTLGTYLNSLFLSRNT